MVLNAILETLSYNPIIVNENMNDNNQDPTSNFFYESVSFSLDTDYVSPKNFNSNFKDYTKNFEWFKELNNLLSFKFSIVYFSETWSKDKKASENSLYQLEVYKLLHQNRKRKNGGGVPYLFKIHILLKKEMILALIVRQMRVSQLR